jgi:aminopeptidase
MLRAVQHVRDILALALEYKDGDAAVVVWDEDCDLARLLASAYRTVLPNATHICFDPNSPDAVLKAFAGLTPGSLVVLIQSTSFRLEAFRIRIELFKRGLKVIEHPHLIAMQPHEAQIYIDALAYDADYYRTIGPRLQQLMNAAGRAEVVSVGHRLTFPSGLEPAKLNIGNYSGMTNIGGQFPIGEVFTESRDLESVYGTVAVFVFGDTRFRVNAPAHPITLIVEKGKVVDTVDSTAEFDRVLAQIRSDEGCVWLREFGFGLNRAMSRQRVVSDIGTFERMCGVHLSLGAKHGVYKKAAIDYKTARHHVDVFAVSDSVWLDERQVYAEGHWIV